MARYQIPKNAGVFRVVSVRAPGMWGVWNDRTGPNKIRIACKNKKQAEELCKRLNDGDHDGEVWM